MGAIAVLATALLLPWHQAGPDDPGALVRLATEAVERDSVDRLAARWTAQLRRSPDDRLAVLGLATLARLTYHYARADSLYGRLLVAPDGDHIAAHARFGLGLSLRARGLQARADTAFADAERAARQAGERGLEAEALIWGAAVRARTVGPRAAAAGFAHAASLLPPGDLRLRALYHCARAETLLLSTDPAAGTEARAGAELAGRVGDRRLLASCQHAIAADFHYRDELDSALAWYSRAIGERRRARDRAGLTTTLQWRGYTYYSIGALGEARRDLEEAVREGEASDNRSPLAWALANLAHLWSDIGDQEAAAGYAARAAALQAELGDRYGKTSVLSLQAGVAAATGRYGEARSAYGEAIRLSEEYRSGPRVVAIRVALAHLAMRDGDWAQAERELRAARAATTRYALPGWAAGLQYHEAALALRRGRLREAGEVLERALATLPASEQHNRHYYAARLAEVYARQGYLDRAQAVLRAAADALDAWRAGLDDRRLRLLAFQASLDYSDPDLGLATVVAALAHGARAAGAFEIAERRRARELLDRLVRAEALGIVESAPPKAAAPRRAIVSLSLPEVTAALPDDSTALLEFVTGQGGEPTTVFVLTRAGLRAQRAAPVDAVAPLVDRFVTALEAGAAAAPLGRRLGAALLDSALAGLPARVTQLVIVPDGVLHWLPFDALRLGKGVLVLERYAVSIAPSASVAARLWSSPRRSDPPAVLAVADPAFAREGDPGSGGDAFRAVFAGHGVLPRLPASQREARVLARLAARSRVLLRREASEANLRREPLREYRVIDFATHALVDEAGPAHTALVLAPGGGDDGLLYEADLEALPLDADLVVLSGCWTAGGGIVRGEGVQGLATPLLAAGARAVLATTWRVRDDAAARFTERFYAALAAGRTTGAALRVAKLAAIASGAPTSEWGAFTLIGDGTVIIPLRQPGSRALPAWIAALGIGAVLAAYRLWIRKRPAVERS